MSRFLNSYSVYPPVKNNIYLKQQQLNEQKLNEQKLNELYQTKNTITFQGHQVPSTSLYKTIPVQNSKFIFANNKCHLDCCPSTFTCDNGCVCMTQKQQQLLNGRGNNNPQSNKPIFPNVSYKVLEKNSLTGKNSPPT